MVVKKISPLFLSTVLASASTLALPLAQHQAIIDDIDGNNSLSFTKDMVSTVDGKYIYSVSSVDHAINVFERGADTHLNLKYVLEEDSAADVGVHSPFDLLLSPDENYVYVLGLDTDGVTDQLFVYQRDLSTGLLTQIQEYSGRGLDSPGAMTISDDGKFIYVTSINSHSVTVLATSSNGMVSEVQYITEVSKGLTSGYQYVSSVVISPDQQHVYVGLEPHSGEGAIVHFNRDQSSGALSYISQVDHTLPNLEDLERPRSMDVSPDGKYLYALSDNMIFEFSIQASGDLGFVRSVMVDNPDSKVQQLYWLNSIQLSENGQLAYITDNVIDAIMVYTRDSNSGSLSYVGAELHGVGSVSEIRGPESVYLASGNHYAYVGSTYGLTEFTIDTDIGVSSQVTQGQSTTDVVYSLVNNGEVTAHNIEISILVGEGATVQTILPYNSDTGCEQQGQVVTCLISNLDPTVEEGITLTLSNGTTTGYSVSSSIALAEVDTNSSNDSTEDTIVNEGSTPVADEPETTEPEPATENTGGGSGGGGSSSVFFLGFLSMLGFIKYRQKRL